MNDSNLLKSNAYTEYWKFVESLYEKENKCLDFPLQLDFLDYKKYNSEAKNDTYLFQEYGFTQELLNTHNQFLSTLNSLILWEEFIKRYTEDEKYKYELRFEFTQKLLYFCLLQPSEFCGRIIFVSTQLCYIHGIFTRKLKKEDLTFNQRTIKGDTLKKMAPYWSEITSLLNSIKNVNGKSFSDTTRDFRNLSQHRIPAGLDIGMQRRTFIALSKDQVKNENLHFNVEKRTIGKYSEVEFISGYENPLRTIDLLPVLISEGVAMGIAFQDYWKLVQEHCAEMS